MSFYERLSGDFRIGQNFSLIYRYYLDQIDQAIDGMRSCTVAGRS